MFLSSTSLSFTLPCFGRLLLLVFLAVSISVLQTAMLQLWLLTALLLLHRTVRKLPSSNSRTNMCIVTPRCAAAAAVDSVVVLRRSTKEYTHPYYMMHRRLPTAGNEFAPHYHQLLVIVARPQNRSDRSRVLPSGKKASSKWVVRAYGAKI